MASRGRERERGRVRITLDGDWRSSASPLPHHSRWASVVAPCSRSLVNFTQPEDGWRLIQRRRNCRRRPHQQCQINPFNNIKSTPSAASIVESAVTGPLVAIMQIYASPVMALVILLQLEQYGKYRLERSELSFKSL